MDWNPSQDHHQGRREERTSDELTTDDVTHEVTTMELYIRCLEDAKKRLDNAPATSFTQDTQHLYGRLQARLFDLST